MKRFGLIFGVLAVCCGVVFGGEKDRCVLLLSTPGVDAGLAKRCFDFMGHNVRGRLRVDRSLLRVDGLAPKEQLKVFGAMRSDGDALVVVLVNSSAATNSVVIYSRSLGAAVVNVAPIMNDKELLPRVREGHVDRAAMYALGHLAGMDSCLNPYCALSEYKHMKKDQMPGRNYCPNCVDRVADKLAVLGVTEPKGDKRKPQPKSGVKH